MILMPYGKAFFRLSLKLLRKHIPVARRGKPKVSHGKTLLLQGRRVKNAHRGCPTGWAASQTKMTPGMFLFSSGPFGRCLLTENLSLTGSKSLQVSIRRDREQSSIHRLAERIAPRLAGTPTQWQWFPRTQIASELCGTHCHQAGGRDLHGHATARRSSEYGHSTGLHSCLWGQCTSPPRARSHPRSSYTRGRSVQPDQSERGPEIAVAYWRNNNAGAFARDGLEHTRLPWPPGNPCTSQGPAAGPGRSDRHAEHRLRLPAVTLSISYEAPYAADEVSSLRRRPRSAHDDPYPGSVQRPLP